ncbi:MAG: hypothetical protein GXP18_00160 [Gammaproteobacteria bacterium]|nr:hypothetical protein [Gammaproteobacteria bacterium]
MSLDAYAAFNGLVPLAHSGRISYMYGYTDSAGTESEATSLLFGWNAGGYIWRPWFATTSMALNVGLTSTESASSSSEGTTGSGNFTLGVFSRSRFPFSLNYSRTDSRSQQFYDVAQVSGETSFRTTRLTLRQSYRPRKYNQLFNGWYNSTRFDGGAFGSNSQAYGLDYKLRVARQTVGASVTHSVVNSRGSPDKSTANVMSVSHVYTPSGELGVNSLLSYVEIDPGRGAVSIDSQAFSSFFWRPEYRAINVSGGVRLSENRTEDDKKTVARSLNTNLGLGYRVTRAFNMSASVSLGTSDTATTQTLSTTQAVSVSYAGGRRQWQGFSHTWRWGASGVNTTNRVDSDSVGSVGLEGQPASTSQQNFSTSIGHGLNRSWATGRRSSLATTFSQSASGGQSSGASTANKSISHGMSVGWNARGKRGSTYLNGRLSDSRSFGERDSVFNSFSLSYATDLTISRLSGITGNASYQASQNTSEDDQGKTTNTTKNLTGGMTYRNGRPFGIYNLSFASSIQGSKQVDSPVPSTTVRWESAFRYSLGLLSTVLSTRVTESPRGRLVKSMNFQATRSF